MAAGTLRGGKLHIEPVYSFPNKPLAINNNLYWSLGTIYQQLLTGLKRAGRKFNRLATLGLDTFSNDFAFVDQQGTLLSPIHCYRDERSIRSAQYTYGRISPERLHALTGNQNAPFNTVMQLGALVQEKKQYYWSPGNKLLLLPDLLGYTLTGVMRAEYSIAAVTQMFDPEAGVWLDEVLEALGIPQDVFPECIMPGEILGEVKEELVEDVGIQGLQVASVCSHDTASAVMALPSNEESTAFISSGTWSIVGTEVERPIINGETFAGNFANEYGYGKRARLSKNVMGLWILQEWKRELEAEGASYDYGELVELASKAAPFRSLIDPNAQTFYTPGNMGQKIRDFCAQTDQPQPEAPGEYVRCILESLALRYRWALEKIQAITGKEIQCIHILGGGSNNKLLNQFTADACGLVVKAGPSEATIYGNLLMQLLAVKRIGSLEEGRELVAASVQPREFTPKEQEAWDKQYTRFLDYLVDQG